MAISRDFTGKNRKFTGTKGIVISSGTTAQRVGNEAGELRFNTSINLMEYYNGTIWKSIDSPPVVISVDVTEVDRLDSTLNQTFIISGSGFAAGATVTFVGNAGVNVTATSTTVNSVSQITAVAVKADFINAQEPYGVKVENASGLSSTLASQINVDSAPTWVTASGSLGTITSEATGTHFTLSATDPDGDTVSYSETTSVLATAGLSINSSTGAISGNVTDVFAPTTYNFTIRATANSKTADRSFSITVSAATNYFGDGSDGAVST